VIDLTPRILYEDDDILAIDKPAGLVVHPDGRTKETSVSEWFKSKYPEAKDVGEPMDLGGGNIIERPGVVHRIDRDTSGLLLLAKTEAGHKTLKSQFQDREIEKTYHLFVYGLLKDDFGTISLPIGRSKSDFRKWVALTQRSLAKKSDDRTLRDALTYYKVLKRDETSGVTFVEAKPQTGRTHQIRVHFKALNHPVLCDRIYSANKENLLGFERLALHARSISFKNTQGKRVALEAPYPEDFSRAIASLGLSVLD
jgi:23S rRNA pseudouridine1911/1915/1917 synthase